MPLHWIRPVAALTLLLNGTYVSANSASNATYQKPPRFVQTMVLDGSDHASSRQFFGEVAALDTVDMSFEVAGHLVFLEAREGASVGAGQLVAALDLDPFERAVERAELMLAQEERKLKRAQTLASRSVTSEVRAEDAQTARDLARVALRDARGALDDAQIHAPFDGIVADRLGTSFSNIEPGQPILRLHDMSEVRVEFDIPERIFARFENADVLSFEALVSGNDRPVSLTFREFRAETDTIGQSYRVSLAVTGETDVDLIPGRTVVVRASLPDAKSESIVPLSSLVTKPDGQTSLVAVEARGSGLFTKHVPVTVRSRDGTAISVYGVEPGTEIVEIGAHLLREGEQIRRFIGLTIEGN